MSVGEMSVGELSVGELSVGEMSVGELSWILRDSSSYYSFHSLGLKYFQFVFRLVTRHLAAYIVRACRSGSVTWPSRPRERGAGGVKL